MTAKGHWETFGCETCEEEFDTEEEAEDHMQEYDHYAYNYSCETCDEMFRTEEDADEHMADYSHYAPRFSCETCDKMFYSSRAASRHMDSLQHWAPRFECETCNAVFYTQDAANRHMTAKTHFSNYCPSCDRWFQNENNLQQHLRSKIHLGQNILCPFCKKTFTTASGVAHHLETGSCTCAPHLNRESIHDLVRCLDKQGKITNKLLEWHASDTGECLVSSNAYNGSAWECYICHRTFKTSSALNQHLNSPTHKQRIYHCPNVNHCGKQFIALAALFNHLESESCSYMRFENVQRNAQGLLTGRNLIGF
ncbi:hypothetical protein BO82DRAFT_384113 [Aspergillus uvarum CBS 121591]|uniref:C2H2-type domain-containing protein n=1 Tax=Aspergillus uvarum CBS 121591 TaxID=1448315 RepID=A0A319C6P7_9EURO|nr:hypothetical protein BO82DRAFT_384113 [Aspergillus uvarum CBS 121591]PYH80884.1 hypothetical protein BO82DRAFT_384113 [Aspergillus uvarum CBS 121591]